MSYALFFSYGVVYILKLNRIPDSTIRMHHSSNLHQACKFNAILLQHSSLHFKQVDNPRQKINLLSSFYFFNETIFCVYGIEYSEDIVCIILTVSLHIFKMMLKWFLNIFFFSLCHMFGLQYKKNLFLSMKMCSYIDHA